MAEGVGARIAAAVRAATASRRRSEIAAALRCVRPDELAVFFHTSLTDDVDAAPLGSGLAASPGAASGRIVLSSDDAVRAADAGDAVILVRAGTTPDDVLGMQASRGILTTRGGLVSHAAVVARGWGIPAVVGAADVQIDGDTVTIGEVVLHAGDEITIDGGSGNIYAGRLGISDEMPPPELATLLAWADSVARGHVQVRANADTAGDARHGRDLGAQGIGLCRTEHMFLAAERLAVMRRFILGDDEATQAAALAELEAVQTQDFETLLEAMDALPVTVRLLDPPLHEFLPDLFDLTAREARGELTDDERIQLGAVRRLHESNPMLGTRGVRLGVVRSGVYEMQVRALCAAAANLFERGRRPRVEIMIPLVVDAEELRIARSWVRDVLDEIGHPELRSSIVRVGAMIETPRAALTAGRIAEHADFFSFGTNDLTQMTYAFSRDDVEARLLPAYQALGILPANPFAVLDQDGVGQLVREACDAARAAKPAIRLGVCGEHAGHPASADFLVRVGVDSVSCSPFRVPLARLAVAQALLDCGRVEIDDVTFDIVEPTAPEGSEAASVAPTGGFEPDEFLVLHTLRVRGFVTSDGLAHSLGASVADLVHALVDTGHVRYFEARDMYSLLPPGKERHASLLDGVASADVVSALGEQYAAFLALNSEFKQLCTDWQVRGGAPNDHTDEAYDRDCLTRLEGLCHAALPVVDAMADVVPRMRRYGERLSSAAAAAAAGEPKRFTGVMCESFHDVWMELHEDLIVVQRIDRTAEGSF